MDPRFSGITHLLGDQGLKTLSKSHVCVVGVGGVGSWVVEGLVRSGIGSVTLIDGDEVCVTNINRQIQALNSTIGQSKVSALAKRMTEINPKVTVVEKNQFCTAKTISDLLSSKFSLVIDAIDRVESKTELIVGCVDRDLPLISIGSAGDRLDPSVITTKDLSDTVYDPLLQCIRKELRRKHDFPRGERKRFGIPCVYAPKQRGERVCRNGQGTRKSCNDGLGSAVHMTAAMGFHVVGCAINVLLSPSPVVYPWKNKSWYQRIQAEKI